MAEVPLLNADAWYGRRAAKQGAEAAAAAARRTRSGTATDVARAYFDAVLAQGQFATMDTALKAARGHVRDAESAVRNVLATRSDALLAAVRAGEVEVQRAQAAALRTRQRVQERLVALRRMRSSLDSLIRACERREDMDDCPLLSALAPECAE